MKRVFLFLVASCFVVQTEAQQLKTVNCHENVTLSSSHIYYKSKNVSGYENLGLIYFNDPQEGWAFSYGADYTGLVRYKNGEWTNKTNPANTDYLFSMDFVDSYNGWAVGLDGSIIKCSGENWTAVNSPSKQILYSVSFADATHGWAVGDSGEILRFDGAVWYRDSSPVKTLLNYVDFVDATHGWAVGDSGVVLKYDGKTWLKEVTPTINPFYAVDFVDATHGWAVGKGIYKYDGKTWKDVTPASMPLDVDLSCVHFTDTAHGWVIGNESSTYTSVIFKYESGSWTMLQEPDSVDLQWIIESRDPRCFFFYTNYFYTDGSSSGSSNKLTSVILDRSEWKQVQDASITYPDGYIVNPDKNVDYYTTITYSDGSVFNDSIKVLVANISSPPSICAVSFDSATNKNRVIWDKTADANIESFRVYRETDVTDVYEKIGEVAKSEVAVFIDNASNPKIQSASYKISSVDACGNEGEKSVLHKTIHLNINKGVGNSWNLIWNDYEGFTASKYKIYRGTTTTDLELIGTTTAGNLSYTDNEAKDGNVYYQIEVVCPNVCVPTRGANNYNVSRSNIATNALSQGTGVEDVEEAITKLNVIPNPANDYVEVEANQLGVISIINANSQELLNVVAKGFKNRIDISSLSRGVYFVKFTGDRGVKVVKLVKE